ncbi:hypothetical protein OESDEN_13276 [Oesophagostomum dentatum]|uniref:Uncharacterized protein n=1 Tax=Oesophagostomum dentatum TaxID=61180 RepID=A0A0B1SPS5_OESDE|nr:hypothetical protein OESDEN_13276 [Oesophagostomum dentatum]
MKLPMEGKVKPIIVQEVQPSQKAAEAIVNADASQPRVTSDEPAKIVFSQPVAVMPIPEKETVALPKEEIASPKSIALPKEEGASPKSLPLPNEETASVKAEGGENNAATKSDPTSPAPQGVSLPLIKSEAKAELKSSVPVAKPSRPSIPLPRPLTTAAARTPDVVKKTVTVNRPRVTRPVLRQQNRVQQPSLRVVNHVVVPQTETPSTGSPLARRITPQNRAGPQLRRPQPSRRASTSLRTVTDAVRTTTSPNKPNIIVIRDGRIVPLTEQQQRDLETILSAMSAAGNDVPIRRRAPLRRGRVVPNRPTVNRQQTWS